MTKPKYDQPLKIRMYNKWKQTIESSGFTMISIEYVNNRTKLEYMCPFGHKCPGSKHHSSSIKIDLITPY